MQPKIPTGTKNSNDDNVHNPFIAHAANNMVNTIFTTGSFGRRPTLLTTMYNAINIRINPQYISFLLIFL